MRYQFQAPICPVVHNENAQGNSNPDMIPELLARQIDSPVRWVESIEHMLCDGVDLFIEVGYGSVLQGLVKKIVPKDWSGRIMGCSKPEDVVEVMKALE
jgi:[acyl-carrier-protein] S-malonyltransferase